MKKKIIALFVMLGVLMTGFLGSTPASADTGTHKYCLSSTAGYWMTIIPDYDDASWDRKRVNPGNCYTVTGQNSDVRIVPEGRSSYRQAWNSGGWGSCHEWYRTWDPINPVDSFDSTGWWLKGYYQDGCVDPY